MTQYSGHPLLIHDVPDMSGHLDNFSHLCLPAHALDQWTTYDEMIWQQNQTVVPDLVFRQASRTSSDNSCTTASTGPPSPTLASIPPFEPDHKRPRLAVLRSATKITTTKRKEQNRAAQRAFRQRQKDGVEELEEKVGELREELQESRDQNQCLESTISQLRIENAEYEAFVSEEYDSRSRN